MKTPKTLGERLKMLREHYRLSQAAFGSKVGLSHVAVSNIEIGAVEAPRQRSLDSIIKEYGTTYEWLMNGEGEMIPGGSHEFQKKSGDLFQDALYKELKEDKTKWEQKFNELLANYTTLVSKLNLGKFKATSIAARSQKHNRVLVVRNP